MPKDLDGGAELTLENIFNEAFKTEMGGGYPKERSVPERENREILADVKKITNKDMLTILKDIDQDFLIKTINRENFKTNFFNNAKENELSNYIKDLLN